MEFLATLVRIGSLLSVLTVAAAGSFLLATGAGADGVPTLGLFATLGLLVVATAVAVAWGRGTALARRETPYW
ncbi:hypothetical protein Hbl1158_09285 [Halobaculum sp. CBA1158]|uniref:hypothetical protein n=1 Tax=Halobaculum sp. CBA1158 TaxID=2904243 RepID=UPI001F46C521|nr:hypothetical protein [Halobaculum sp. CBA1158]UIO98737.1 hypothetical protein Hbl1158_09285 [Halobaculum sp. CBA1158]